MMELILQLGYFTLRFLKTSSHEKGVQQKTLMFFKRKEYTKLMLLFEFIIKKNVNYQRDTCSK